MAVAVAQTGNPNEKIRTGETVSVAQGETVDHDLYLFGTEVTVSGTVNGDVVLAANDATINGTVNGDILGAAATLGIGGTVNGDVRAAVGSLTIGGTVSEDVAVLANTIDLASSGHIGQDLLFSATDAQLDGSVGGGITGSASSYVRDGTVGGQETVSEAAQDQSPESRTMDLALNALRQYLVVLLFGVVGLLVAPSAMAASALVVRRRLLIAFVLGLFVAIGVVLAAIGIFVLMVLLAIAFGQLRFDSLVGVDIVGGLIAISGILFSFVVFVAFIGDAIVGLALGRLIAAPEGRRLTEVLRLAVGSAIVVLVTSFPEVGGVAKLLVALVALGAVAIVVNERRHRQPVGPPLAAPASPDLPAQT